MTLEYRVIFDVSFGAERIECKTKAFESTSEAYKFATKIEVIGSILRGISREPVIRSIFYEVKNDVGVRARVNHMDFLSSNPYKEAKGVDEALDELAIKCLESLQEVRY